MRHTMTVGAMTSLAMVQAWYADPVRAERDANQLRWWPRGVRCPTCHARNPYWFESRRVYCCRKTHRRRQFTVKTGTIMADSPIPIGTWLTAIWILSRGRVSSYELAQALGLTQKSAWALVHRIEMAARAPVGERGQPFERFARRILTATPAEVAAEERVYQRRQKRRRDRLAALTQLTERRAG